MLGFFYCYFVFLNFFCIFTIMRKYAFIFAVIALTALTSCGSGSTTEVTTDSTEVKVDTVLPVTIDTTVVEVKDSSSVK